jgi:hypothetical protein
VKKGGLFCLSLFLCKSKVFLGQAALPHPYRKGWVLSLSSETQADCLCFFMFKKEKRSKKKTKANINLF